MRDRCVAIAVAAIAACNGVLGIRQTVPADGGVTCPSMYTFDPITGSHYKVKVVSGTKFDPAESACENDEGQMSITGHTHLVVIANDAELAEVHALVGSATAWIGLQHRREGEFIGSGSGGVSAFTACYHWVTNAPVTADCIGADACYWDTNQPAQPATNGCAVMLPDGRLAAAQCDTPTPTMFVCQCDAFARSKLFANAPSCF